MAATALKFRLFLGSYAVLFAILGIRFSGRWLSWGCLVVAAWGILDNVRIVLLARRKGPYSYKVETVRDHGAEVAGYLATYLLPFVTVAQPSARDLWGYALFLAVTCLVYVRSEMVQINPVMYILGRRIVGISTSDGLHVHLISARLPEIGQTVDAVPLRGNHVMVEVQRHSGDEDS